MAWRSLGGLSVIRRAAGAAFGPPETVQDTERNRNQTRRDRQLLLRRGDGPPYDGRPALRLLLGADGRAAGDLGRRRPGAPTRTTLDPGSPPVVARVGSPLRDPQGLTPLLLADGTRAIAWSDNNAPLAGRAFAGRVHVAVEGRAGGAGRAGAGARGGRAARPLAAPGADAPAARALQRRVRRPDRERRSASSTRGDAHARRDRPLCASSRCRGRWPRRGRGR